MRLGLPLALALALLSSCSSTPTRRTASSGAAAGEAPMPARGDANGPSDPGSLDVVDPVAAPAGDHFPGAALASSGAEPAERPNTLAPGFLIRLAHQEDRDLNGTFRIEFDGKINLPYNVSFRAQGLTMDEFRQRVIESYKPFYKSGMRLTVELVEKAYYVELRGLIKKPGRYKVKGDTSLDEVISLGEGFPSSAESQPRYLKISHGDISRMVDLEDYYKSGTLKVNTPWHGGEILFFQKEGAFAEPGSLDIGNQIQVLGELKKPGEFVHRPGADIYFYMAEAGGPTRDTDFDKVEIYRGPAGKREMMEFALDKPERIPAVLPGDMLVFRADNTSKAQLTMSTVTSVASIISAIALLIIAL